MDVEGGSSSITFVMEFGVRGSSVKGYCSSVMSAAGAEGYTSSTALALDGSGADVDIFDARLMARMEGRIRMRDWEVKEQRFHQRG